MKRDYRQFGKIWDLPSIEDSVEDEGEADTFGWDEDQHLCLDCEGSQADEQDYLEETLDTGMDYFGSIDHEPEAPLALPYDPGLSWFPRIVPNPFGKGVIVHPTAPFWPRGGYLLQDSGTSGPGGKKPGGKKPEGKKPEGKKPELPYMKQLSIKRGKNANGKEESITVHIYSTKDFALVSSFSIEGKLSGCYVQFGQAVFRYKNKAGKYVPIFGLEVPVTDQETKDKYAEKFVKTGLPGAPYPWLNMWFVDNYTYRLKAKKVCYPTEKKEWGVNPKTNRMIVEHKLKDNPGRLNEWVLDEFRHSWGLGIIKGLEEHFKTHNKGVPYKFMTLETRIATYIVVDQRPRFKISSSRVVSFNVNLDELVQINKQFKNRSVKVSTYPMRTKVGELEVVEAKKVDKFDHIHKLVLNNTMKKYGISSLNR